MKLSNGFIFIIFLGINITIVGCQQQSSISENKKTESKDLEFKILPPKEATLPNEEKITFLKKIGEIKDGFCEEEYNYFVKITSLCVDADDNLYVVDSGLHRIFKFSNQGKYISSFGSQGQGPGEFLGTIRASVGNDGKLYVTDDANWRMFIFSTKGEFIRQFPIEKNVPDVPLVNSKGEIYLLSGSGLKVIDYFDSNMKLRQSLLDINYYLNFPFKHPPKKILRLMVQGPSIYTVKKLLTRDDRLVAIFNNTQLVVLFDKNHRIVEKFRIKHPRFVKDYEVRLEACISKGSWLNCFGSAFFDPDENLGFCYYNASLGLPEIYRYGKEGVFIDTLRIKNIEEKTNHLINACNNKGNFFSVESDSTKILIYHMAN